MNTYKVLVMDESGKADYEHESNNFVLAGVVIPESKRILIDRKVRKIKKKFFQNEDIILHWRDMVRYKGIFSILRDQTVKVSFWSEFLSLMNVDDIVLYFVITDKHNAQMANWSTDTILKRSYIKILEEFAKNIKLANCNGKIIMESGSSSQDIQLINAHSRLNSMGTYDRAVTPYDYRKSITCLSLVNKENSDAEVQIADMLAPIARLMYRSSIAKSSLKFNQSDKAKIRLIERKLKNVINKSMFEILI